MKTVIWLLALGITLVFSSLAFSLTSEEIKKLRELGVDEQIIMEVQKENEKSKPISTESPPDRQQYEKTGYFETVRQEQDPVALLKSCIVDDIELDNKTLVIHRPNAEAYRGISGGKKIELKSVQLELVDIERIQFISFLGLASAKIFPAGASKYQRVNVIDSVFIHLTEKYCQPFVTEALKKICPNAMID